MMGPSAPNGPPVPMAMAAEIGFRIATLGSMRLRLTSTASIASGMPWPRILSEPVARHDADDEAADDRRDDHQQSEMVIARAEEGERKPVVEEEVGEKPDEVVQQIGDDAGQDSDHAGQQRNHAGAEASLPVRLASRPVDPGSADSVHRRPGFRRARSRLHRFCGPFSGRSGFCDCRFRPGPVGDLAQHGHQRRRSRPQFGAIVHGQLPQYPLAAWPSGAPGPGAGRCCRGCAWISPFLASRSTSSTAL